MDYTKETEALDKGNTTWKPAIGMHKVTILSEPVDDEYIDKATGQKTPQIHMMVEVNEEQYDWYVTKGKTTGSIYGQLMYLGRLKGKLIGSVVSIIVNETKTKDGSSRKQYICPEAIDAIKALKPAKEVSIS